LTQQRVDATATGSPHYFCYRQALTEPGHFRLLSHKIHERLACRLHSAQTNLNQKAGIMRQNIHLLSVSVLFAALFPMTVWGYGFFDDPGDRGYLPRAGSASGHHYSGSLRLQTSMTGDGYYIRANVAGLRPEDVQVYLRRNRVILQIAQGDQYGQYNPGARRTSQWQMHFRRQLRLPYDADWSRRTTNTSDAIMEIYIPRTTQYMPTGPFLNQ